MTPSDKYLQSYLQAAYNIKADSILPLFEGADTNAERYKVQALDSRCYFVKVQHGSDRSLKIFELFRENGLDQIIFPLNALDGSSIEPSITVYPFIEGPNGFSQKLTEKEWLSLGIALKKLHTLDIPPSLAEAIRKETYSPKFRDAVRALYTQECKASDPISHQFLRDLETYKETIKRLLDQAESLAESIKHQASKFVLCHSDIHAGNVLLPGKDKLFILDWDDPILAPKERDLMFIGGGIGGIWNEPHEEAFFYKGYGNTDINKTILAYYRHERIVEDIAEFAKLFLTDVTNPIRKEMYAHFINMFNTNNVIEIAFKSL